MALRDALEPQKGCQNVGTGQAALRSAKWQRLYFEVLKRVFVLGRKRRLLNTLQTVCANAAFDLSRVFLISETPNLLLTLQPSLSSVKVSSSPLIFYLEKPACFEIFLCILLGIRKHKDYSSPFLTTQWLNSFSFWPREGILQSVPVSVRFFK